MKKNFKKAVAIILIISVLGALCITPVIPAVADVPEDETYEAFDEITYSSLFQNGSTLKSQFSLSGPCVLKYNRTSPTGSAKFKFRWIVGNIPKFQLSFEKTADDTMDYMFGVQLESAVDMSGSEAVKYPNGAVWLRPGMTQKVGLSTPIISGSTHDVEFARLKVAEGANQGKYYVYFMIDGTVIADSYVAANVVADDLSYTSDPNATKCSMKSGEIFMVAWGSENNKLCKTPDVPEYEPYDEIYYSNLKKNGSPVETETEIIGNNLFTYNRTSPTGSAVLKYHWKIGNAANLQLSFEKTSDTAMENTFGAILQVSKDANTNGFLTLMPGSGQQINLYKSIMPYTEHDIEYGRLKVAKGTNKGRYYVYFKIDNQLIAGDYVESEKVDSKGNYISSPGSVTCSVLAGEIFMAIPDALGHSINESPYTEEYEEYDDINYNDLKDINGNDLPVIEANLSGASVFKYEQNSPTGSVILKYRWKIGDTVRCMLSFEKTSDSIMEYMFGACLDVPDEIYNNGTVWLRPGFNRIKNLPSLLEPFSVHNVEYARLKVATGPKKGKYYLYIKIDDVVLASDYVDQKLVSDDLKYISNPNSTECDIKSGEIFLSFLGSEGNTISPYRKIVNGHEFTRCDFDYNRELNQKDVIALEDYLSGGIDKSAFPSDMADFNNDHISNVTDLVDFKKDISAVNYYKRTGDYAVGTQEHLDEDSSKTADYIADASATLGANAYRMSITISNLFNTTSTNGVSVKTANMNKLKAQVAALKEKGITNILYVTDTFLLPYRYGTSGYYHYITVPDPVTDKATYEKWLKVNYNGFKRLAQEVPEIKAYEPFNEINLTGTRFEKYGVGWNDSAEKQAAHKFSVKEKAYIIADLCWTVSDAVKSVNPDNQVTTPSIAVQSSPSVEHAFTNELYKAIESGAHPSNQTVGDIRVDNYFTVINIHTYPSYSNDSAQQEVSVASLASEVTDVYGVVKLHGDGNSPVWLTETGMSSYNPDSTSRNETAAGNIVGKVLKKLSAPEFDFLETVILYKLADVSSDNTISATEAGYGLFYAGDDLDCPFEAKPTAKAVYSYLHNGSTDYSVLDELARRSLAGFNQ